jgi:hypothetical protein
LKALPIIHERGEKVSKRDAKISHSVPTLKLRCLEIWRATKTLKKVEILTYSSACFVLAIIAKPVLNPKYSFCKIKENISSTSHIDMWSR